MLSKRVQGSSRLGRRSLRHCRLRLDRVSFSDLGAEISETSRIRPFARKLAQAARRARSYPKLRFGEISSTRPLSTAWGFDRGTPIDRYYIDKFLSEHAADIRGRVLEVGDDSYSRRFGGDRIGRQDVLHVDDSNSAATIVGDLASSDLLPASSFDCMILTQTLQYVFDLPASLAAIRRALRPGGVALITVPATSPIGYDQWANRFYWRFSLPSMKRLLAAAFEPAMIEVEPLGNLYAATAFLHGAAVEEVSKKKLQHVMPEYAVIIAARAVA